MVTSEPDTVPVVASEVPVGPLANGAEFGSDVVADTLRDLGIEYIALNPGASFRGLHDSLVNYLGNKTPSMLLCLHEEHAVAIAHGFAKVTGRAMAAATHSNVGLMHATMAIFNAWCDRMPVLVIGATGPVDAAARRPWIDWIHTARDQGALVRPYTKWDDQPASPAAAQESVTRAVWLAETQPQAPVYVNLDAGLQEARLPAPPPGYDTARHRPAVSGSAGTADIDALADLISAAQRPLILQGRAGRSEAAWADRVRLAETMGARVLTDIKVGAGFPTDHPLHAGILCGIAAGPVLDPLRQADLILSLDWVDLAGTLAGCDMAALPKVAQISLDHQIHNGWSMDHQGLPPADVMVAASPDDVAGPLAEALLARGYEPKSKWPAAPPATSVAGSGGLSLADIATQLKSATTERAVSLCHVPISWQGPFWHFRHPLDYLGSDGGGGIGAGPGISVGAALALRGTDRMPVAICGDGDFLMGATAIWTAVRYRIPLIIIVANNRSFFNDEIHQQRVATARNRPIENRWIGQKMIDPEIDIAGLARAQGAIGIGPVTELSELADACTHALAAFDAGNVAVIDVHIDPGYPAETLAQPDRMSTLNEPNT